MLSNLKLVDYFLAFFGGLAFWYSYYSITINEISVRGTSVSFSDQPAMFVFLLGVVICSGIYCWFINNKRAVVFGH
ncbi:hypothetical protein L2755_12570 [Shewanella abyssi]|uniref:hypothetical protein n=1 Tax=Shewanella abyssi TaxID=311789 RepID=UPI00200D16F0|nr:hypothetical protein [Shewanella abyssi]MCL1050456.1 hypothetical protein [Shewanella abyssi]